MSRYNKKEQLLAFKACPINPLNIIFLTLIIFIRQVYLDFEGIKFGHGNDGLM